MKTEEPSEDTHPAWIALGAVLTAFVVITITLTATVGWSWVNGACAPDCFRSEAAAAWLQAIGSLVALGLALWIPMRMRKLELADRKMHDRELAAVRALKVGFKLRFLESFADMFLDEIAAHEKHGEHIDFDALREFFGFVDVPDNEDVLAVQQVNDAAGTRLAVIMACVGTVQAALRGTEKLKDRAAATRVGMSQKFIVETIRLRGWLVPETPAVEPGRGLGAFDGHGMASLVGVGQGLPRRVPGRSNTQQ